jgi:ferredoxin
MVETAMEKKTGPPINVFPDRCAGCMICQLRCSLRFEKEFNPSKAKIDINRRVNSDTEYDISFSADCDNCGICARNCPYEALNQDKGKEAR